MKKSRAVFGIVLNLLILAVLGFAFANGYFGFVKNPNFNDPWIKDLTFFQYFTNNANVLLGLSALISFIACIAAAAGKRYGGFVAGLKLVSVTATTVTMITVLAYLAPKDGWWVVTDYSYNLLVHVVVPVLGIASFIVENKPHLKWPAAFLGIIPVAAYAGVMVPMVNNAGWTDPYGFIAINNDAFWINIVVIAAYLVGSFLIALILLLLHNIGSKEGEEVLEKEADSAGKIEQKPEEKPEEKAEEEKSQEEQKDNAEEAKNEGESAQPEAKPAVIRRSYHITKQPGGKWQVKLANGGKAIRVFDTQSEAIAFTKGLVESRGGNYHIHSVKGKLRK